MLKVLIAIVERQETMGRRMECSDLEEDMAGWHKLNRNNFHNILLQALFICKSYFVLYYSFWSRFPPPSFLSNSIPPSKQKERPYFHPKLELNLGKQIANHIPKLGGTITHNSAETSPVGMQLPVLTCFLLRYMLCLFTHSLTHT